MGNRDRWATWEKANLDKLLEEGESRTTFLLRFTNSHPGMNANSVGTKNAMHLEENMHAVSREPLPTEVYAQAKRRLDEAAPNAQ